MRLHPKPQPLLPDLSAAAEHTDCLVITLVRAVELLLRGPRPNVAGCQHAFTKCSVLDGSEWARSGPLVGSPPRPRGVVELARGAPAVVVSPAHHADEVAVRKAGAFTDDHAGEPRAARVVRRA